MRINALGPLEVAADDPVELGPPKHRALLAVLVVRVGAVVAADTLVEQVWPGGSGSHASLHVAMSNLRRRLRGAGVAIETQAPGYRLAIDPDAVDAVRFERGLSRAQALASSGHDDEARAELAAASGLWRGEALADITTDDARREADRLDSLRLVARELEAELDLRAGRHAVVAEVLAPLVRDHPLREGLRGALMLALYRSGRQADALRSYAEGEALLADELGVDPGPSLRHLRDRIVDHDEGLDHTASPAPSAPARPAGFVGRAETSARLVSALGHDGAAVAVVGEAGVGKTRLVEQVTAGSGRPVHTGRCAERAGTPALRPWAQVLSSMAHSLGEEATARAVAHAGPEVRSLLDAAVGGAARPPTLDPAPDRLADAVAVFLEHVATHEHPVVVLEDAQWADAETLELLAYVLQAVRGGPLAVLLTVRTPSGTTHDVGDDALAIVARAPRHDVVRLDGLSEDEVAELAADRLGRRLTDEQVAALHRRTSGNPSFVHELINLHREEREEHGEAAGTVPDTVRTVVERRLTQLPPASRRVLEAAALLGSPFAVADLARLGDLEPADLASAVDDAARRGLVAPDGAPGSYSFGHGLVAETLVLGLRPMRRAALHAAIADALDPAEAASADRRRAAAVAHHWLEAGSLGDPARAVAATLLAARVDAESGAYAESLRRLDAALASVGLLEPQAALRAELGLRSSRAYALSRLHSFHDHRVDEERARCVALARRLDDPLLLLPGLWSMWMIALLSGRIAAADHHASEIVAAGVATGSPALRTIGHYCTGQTRWHQGRLDDAVEHFTSSHALMADQPGPFELDGLARYPHPSVAAWCAIALAERGDHARADELAAEAQAHPRYASEPFNRVHVDSLLALKAVVDHDPERALALAEPAHDRALAEGLPQMSRYALMVRGWARALDRGEVEAGLGDVDAARQAMLQVTPVSCFEPVAAYLAADVLASAGEPEAATDVADAGLAYAARHGLHGLMDRLRSLRADLGPMSAPGPVPPMPAAPPAGRPASGRPAPEAADGQTA